MGKKDGMYFYCDWLAPFEKLEKAEVGELVIAMMKYFQSGEEPPAFEGMLGMAADFIFPQIDRSMEYARLGSRGGNATKARALAKKESPKAEKLKEEVKKEEDMSTEEFLAREYSAFALSDYGVEEPECEAKAPEEPAPESSAAVSGFSEAEMFKRMQKEDFFNKFWRSYPKKVGRQEALAVFERLSPDRRLVNEMVEAIAKQKETQCWKKEGGRFVPNPAKWLEGRRWEDEISEDVSDDGSFDTDDFFEAALRRSYEDSD